MWKIYAAYGNLLTDGWSWQIFVSSSDVLNCLFHSTNTMKYSFHQDSSVIHCWFVYWVSSWEVRCLSKSSEISLNGTVFVFHLAWYITGLKSHKRFRPYLMASRSCRSWRISLSNHCIWCLFFFFHEGFMRFHEDERSSWGYCMHVSHDKDNWPSIRFEISLQNFTKPLDIFWPQIERNCSEEFLAIILAVKRKLWAIFLPRVHVEK